MTTPRRPDTPNRTGFSQRPRMRTTVATSEARLEKMLHDGIRRAGGMSFKMAPTTAGLPDRMVLWPGGRIELVELKTTKGRMRRIQEIWHYRMAKLGTEVLVLHGDSDVQAYLASKQQDYLASKQQAVSA